MSSSTTRTSGPSDNTDQLLNICQIARSLLRVVKDIHHYPVTNELWLGILVGMMRKVADGVDPALPSNTLEEALTCIKCWIGPDEDIEDVVEDDFTDSEVESSTNGHESEPDSVSTDSTFTPSECCSSSTVAAEVNKSTDKKSAAPQGTAAVDSMDTSSEGTSSSRSSSRSSSTSSSRSSSTSSSSRRSIQISSNITMDDKTHDRSSGSRSRSQSNSSFAKAVDVHSWVSSITVSNISSLPIATCPAVDEGPNTSNSQEIVTPINEIRTLSRNEFAQAAAGSSFEGSSGQMECKLLIRSSGMERARDHPNFNKIIQKMLSCYNRHRGLVDDGAVLEERRISETRLTDSSVGELCALLKAIRKYGNTINVLPSLFKEAQILNTLSDRLTEEELSSMPGVLPRQTRLFQLNRLFKLGTIYPALLRVDRGFSASFIFNNLDFISLACQSDDRWKTDPLQNHPSAD